MSNYEIGGHIEKEKDEKSPVATGASWCKLWEDRSTVNVTLHETISNDDF